MKRKKKLRKRRARKIAKRWLAAKKRPKIKKPEKSAPVVKKHTKEVLLRPIEEIARSIGIKKEFLETYGPYKAKVSLDILDRLKPKKTGKYVLVTSITPTHFGEGKTVTTIGLSMALNRLKKKSIACLMQPALGGIFGMKGTGTGFGLAQVFPAEDVNLYLTGDSLRVVSAQNLCAAYLDNFIYRGNPLGIDPLSITWKRVADSNDRSLRNVNTGLGGKSDGISRKTGFDTAGASELMSILALSRDMKDLRERIGRIVLGFTASGKAVTCEDIKVAGSLAALLKDAIKPNLLQTGEKTACFVHTGSFGDVSLGFSSVVADRIALGLADYVIAETGYGADLGAEKFFDIKCRVSGIRPAVAVLVCSVRALKMHSGDFELTKGKPFPKDIFRENIFSLEKGLSNLEKHAENFQTFGVPFILCINRFDTDTEKEIATIKRRAENAGAKAFAVSSAASIGSEGALSLAEAVIGACKEKNDFRFLYPLDLPLKDKIKRITKTIYGAREVKFSEEVDKKAALLKKAKLDNLAICMAKTHLSLSHSPTRLGRPHGFKFPLEDIRLYNGAGYITAFSSNIETMPGLPKTPRGTKIDIDDTGKITGLF